MPRISARISLFEAKNVGAASRKVQQIQNSTTTHPTPDQAKAIISGLAAQNMASRVDETQLFASRVVETVGFDRWCHKIARGLSQATLATRGGSEWMDPILFHLDVRTPHAGASLGNE